MLLARSATSHAHLRSHSVRPQSRRRVGLRATVTRVCHRSSLVSGAALGKPPTSRPCVPGEPLDTLGRHRAACPRTARLRRRATPIERMLACCRAGEPHPNTADVDGAALAAARADKERTYPELTTSGRCRVVVVAIETGGRWSSEAVEFVRQLAFARAREVPSFMQFTTALAWEWCWTRMLSIACSLSFAASLVEPSDKCETWCRTGGEPPSLAELLECDGRLEVRQFLRSLVSVTNCS